MKYGIVKFDGWARCVTVMRIWDEDGYTWVQECAKFDDEAQGKGAGLEDAKTFISMKRSAEQLKTGL